MEQPKGSTRPVERRQRKRFLTLRNLRYALLALVVILAGLTIRSEMRDSTGEDFGRLYQGELKKAPVTEPVVVTERELTPVNEAASADPFSLEAAAREQYLGRASLTPEPVIEPSGDMIGLAAPVTPATTARVRIVGGPDGVSLVQDERRAPVLAGGFGRK